MSQGSMQHCHDQRTENTKVDMLEIRGMRLYNAGSRTHDPREMVLLACTLSINPEDH